MSAGDRATGTRGSTLSSPLPPASRLSSRSARPHQFLTPRCWLLVLAGAAGAGAGYCGWLLVLVVLVLLVRRLLTTCGGGAACQFHTHESIEMKEEECHNCYELFRVADDPHKRIQYWEEMVSLWDVRSANRTASDILTSLSSPISDVVRCESRRQRNDQPYVHSAYMPSL